MTKQAQRSLAATAASILFFISGVGWFIGGVPVLVHIMASRELPIVFGIRGGSGPIYETFGIDGVIVGQTLFDILHVLEIVAGFWLWKSLRKGAVLGILTIALGPIFWIGFGLPIPPIYALLTLPVIVAAWKTLR